jgi:hypothetical protein
VACLVGSSVIHFGCLEMALAGESIGLGQRGNVAGDSLTQRIEAVEQRLKSLREHAQATPEQQPRLAAPAEDLALALGSFAKTPTLL